MADFGTLSVSTDLRSRISLDVLADRHQQQAERGKKCRRRESLRAAPRVDDLGYRELQHAAEDVRQDGDGGYQRMRRELANNVWHEVEDDLPL